MNHKTLSQKNLVLNHLQHMGELSSMQAIIKYGCTRLASRVCELRKAGWNIISNNSSGYAVYSLAEYGDLDDYGIPDDDYDAGAEAEAIETERLDADFEMENMMNCGGEE